MFSLCLCGVFKTCPETCMCSLNGLLLGVSVTVSGLCVCACDGLAICPGTISYVLDICVLDTDSYQPLSYKQAK